MLKNCAANRKIRLSALPNVSPYIYTTLKFLALQGAPYIYDISRLRVKYFKFLNLLRFKMMSQVKGNSINNGFSSTVLKLCWGRPFKVPNPKTRNPTYITATTEAAPTYQICDITKNDESEVTWLLQRISSSVCND
jgi:hypothetical protein